MALLAHWTEEDSKAASRSRSLALVHSAPVAELDLNLSWRERQGFPPCCSSVPTPETSHRHTTTTRPPHTHTPPKQGSLTRHRIHTHTITCVPTAPSTGPGIQQMLNKCLQNRWTNLSKGPCVCAHTAMGPLGRPTLPNNTASREAHTPAAR